VHNRKNLCIVRIIFNLIRIANILERFVKQLFGSTSTRPDLHYIDVLGVLHEALGNEVKDDQFEEEQGNDQEKEGGVIPSSKNSCNYESNLPKKFIVQAVDPGGKRRAVRSEDRGHSEHPNAEHEVDYHSIRQQARHLDVQGLTVGLGNLAISDEDVFEVNIAEPQCQEGNGCDDWHSC
jgi:hypothetical protein